MIYSAIFLLHNIVAILYHIISISISSFDSHGSSAQFGLVWCRCCLYVNDIKQTNSNADCVASAKKTSQFFAAFWLWVVRCECLWYPKTACGVTPFLYKYKFFFFAYNFFFFAKKFFFMQRNFVFFWKMSISIHRLSLQRYVVVVFPLLVSLILLCTRLSFHFSVMCMCTMALCIAYTHTQST